MLTIYNSTSSHGIGLKLNHGGTISFTAVLTQNKDWNVNFGTGQSGNCTNNELKPQDLMLIGKSTQLTVLRMGDVPN